MPISPDRCKSRAAQPTGGTKIVHPLATFATRKLLARGLAAASQFARTLLRLCFAKLLVLLVGGPDDFVAGASPFESYAFFGAFSTRVFGHRIGFQMANQ